MRKISVVEALESYEQISEHFNLELFIVALAVSLAASFAASVMYRYFYESRGTGSQVSKAFPLLGLAITTLFVCIQVSIPLSLGLMGSLSIIRFRTPIKEPEEVGFIMLVIAASIAAATYNFSFIVALYLFALFSLVVSRKVRGMAFLKRDGLLSLTAPDASMSALEILDAPLKRHLRRYAVQNASSRDGKTSLQITFAGLRTDVAKLQAELRQALPLESINVFLDRPGGIR